MKKHILKLFYVEIRMEKTRLKRIYCLLLMFGWMVTHTLYSQTENNQDDIESRLEYKESIYQETISPTLSSFSFEEDLLNRYEAVSNGSFLSDSISADFTPDFQDSSLPWDPRLQAINSSPFGSDYEKEGKLSFSLMYAFTFSGKRSSYPLSGSTVMASMLYQKHISEKWGISIAPYVAHYTLYNAPPYVREKNGVEVGFDAMLSYFVNPDISINAYRHQTLTGNKTGMSPLLNPMMVPHNRTGINVEFTKNNATFTIGVEHIETKASDWRRGHRDW